MAVIHIQIHPQIPPIRVVVMQMHQFSVFK